MAPHIRILNRHYRPCHHREIGRLEFLLKPDDYHDRLLHKVVDCQWAAPPTTPVPEYIRLIAHGRSPGLHDQLEVQRLPGNPRRTSRQPMRASLTAEAGRGRNPGARQERTGRELKLKRVADDFTDDERHPKASMPRRRRKNGSE